MGWDNQWWQEYNESGSPIGQALNGERAATGVLHGSSHVWIWRHRNDVVEILLQRRARQKRTWPGLWDISAAGHMDYGETPLEAALRETTEELGLALKQEELKLLFVHRQYFVSEVDPVTIENEFQFVYGIQLDAEIEFVMQPGEVDAVQWVNVAACKQMIENGEIVPQGDAYFVPLFTQLERITT